MHTVVNIYGRNLVFTRICTDTEIFKGKCLTIIKLLLGIGLHRVPVKHHVTDVHILSRQSHIIAIGGGTHGKEKSASHHKIPYLVSHCQLQLAHLAESQFLCRCLLRPYIFYIPLLVAIVAPKLTILAGKILMVQVQPVVLWQYARYHLLVIHHIVGYLSVGKHKRHRIIPRQFVLGRINRYLRSLLQLYRIHIHCWVGNFGKDSTRLAVGYRFARHTPQSAFFLQQVGILHHEASSPIVQKPSHLHVTLQGIVGHSVGFQVVFLHLIHRDKQIACPCRNQSQKK